MLARRACRYLLHSVPTPPKSKLDPLRWDLSPADNLEYHFTIMDEKNWKEVYFHHNLQNYEPMSAKVRQMIEKWEKELDG